jgi:hypothetical protein
MDALSREIQVHAYSHEFQLLSTLNLQDLRHRRSTNRTQPFTPLHHPQAALPINIHPKGSMQNPAKERDIAKGVVGDTSIFSNPLLLQFLVKHIPSSNCRDMISIPKDISHRHSNSECNADIK